MGISQWQLRRPEVLKGAVNIHVSDHIRLVVISEQELNPNEDLLKDILLSAQLTPKDCLFIDFEKAYHLNVRYPTNYWLLTQNSKKIELTSVLCKHQLNLWQSPDLAELKQNPQAKRVLWQHIQTALSRQN
ncbi:MAG TPA: DNA polymerase III subunit psi [Pasteurellaceae bacterium]|nr:DNA polymerase III subunit psi [Pasteurellaceae bacterium]